MAATRLPIRRLRELLRLKYEAGLSHRAIAQACTMGLGTGDDVSAMRGGRRSGVADGHRMCLWR